MPTISVTLPVDGENADASDIDNPILAMLAVINGGLDDANIASLSGTKITSGTLPITALTDTANSGWVTGKPAPTAITALGNRSYNLTYAASILPYQSVGMRRRLTRSVAAPTQCTSLNGSTQFYSKTSPAGMAFTNNFVVSTWVKLTSYAAAGVVTRGNASGGWDLTLTSSGQVQLLGRNASSANFRGILSYQSIPLNRWVHIAAQIDMTVTTNTPTTNYVMIDGVDAPGSSLSGGTNPTSLTQSGNLEIGSYNGGTQPLPGKIAQVAIYNAKVTQTTILASMHQTLVGTETSLISAYSFNNTINDLNVSNANNLTPNGSAVATNADSPFGNSATSSTLEYGITTAIASNGLTETVQVPEGCAIPTSGGVTSVAYSAQGVPYGFPKQEGKWYVEYINKQQASKTTPTVSVWYSLTGSNVTDSAYLNVPIGDWVSSYLVSPQNNGAAGALSVQTTLSTANNTESDPSMTTHGETSANAATFSHAVTRHGSISIVAATNYYLNTKANNITTGPSIYNRGEIAPTIIRVKCAHL